MSRMMILLLVLAGCAPASPEQQTSVANQMAAEEHCGAEAQARSGARPDDIDEPDESLSQVYIDTYRDCLASRGYEVEYPLS